MSSDRTDPGACDGENDVALVVVTYDSAADVADLVASLDAGLRGVGRYELVVVDNDSSDGTADEVARVAPWATLVLCTLWIVPSTLTLAINCEMNRPWTTSGGQCQRLVSNLIGDPRNIVPGTY